VTGTVAEIAALARKAGITRTALLIVGDVVRAGAAPFEHSALYS